MLVWQKARNKARETLDEYWDGNFPVDPHVIARQMGFKVEYPWLDSTISGMIQVDPELGRSIYINQDNTPARQRFTVAHELGHFVEREDAGVDDFNIIEYRGGEYDLHEFFADEYAGALLMPEQAIEEFYEARKSPREAAQFFGVSVAAVRRRWNRILKARKQFA